MIYNTYDVTLTGTAASIAADGAIPENQVAMNFARSADWTEVETQCEFIRDGEHVGDTNGIGVYYLAPEDHYFFVNLQPLCECTD